MKTIIFCLCCFLCFQVPGSSQQLQYYYEDFSGVLQGALGGSNNWFTDSLCHTSSPVCFRDTVPAGAAGTNAYFMTNSMDFSSFGYVSFQFNHICKIPPAERATIEVSTNGTGGPWVQLTGAYYKTNFYKPGSSPFFPTNDYFSSIAYPSVWQPANPFILPDSSWWRNEKFDISALAAFQPDVRIRFTITNYTGNGALSPEYGWLIDDIDVQAAPSPPPVINLISTTAGTPVPGPVNFVMSIPSTGTGCCNAIYMYYTVNAGPYQALVLANTAADIWTCTLPTLSSFDTVCYYFQALDWNMVEGNYPASYIPPASPSMAFGTPGYVNCFVYQGGIWLPYAANFDNNQNGWYVDSSLNQGSYWEWGTPNVGFTSGSRSFPNCWDVDLHSPYVINTHTFLYPPEFPLPLTEFQLSFWRNHNLQAGRDGMRVEYEVNQSGMWNTLGFVGDPNGMNWYDTTIAGSGLPAQPGWSGNTSGTWFRSTYRLKQFIGMAGTIRFRFVFDSDNFGNLDGVSIDDFLLDFPCDSGLDVSAWISGWGFMPGKRGTICMTPLSYGCNAPPGQIKIILDSLLTPLPDSTYTIQGDTVIFATPGFMGSGYGHPLYVRVITDSSAVLGDSVCVTALVYPIAGDTVPSNNTVVKCWPVRNAWDPNTKTALPEGSGSNHAIRPDQELMYSIHFQNTGTATATNVTIVDTLDPSLDATTYEVVSSSHPVSPTLLPGNILRFTFMNINLPDSNANELLSHGFVNYRIHPAANVMNGAVIHNSASIFFDLNAPVITDTTFHTVDFFLGIRQPQARTMVARIYPNPAHDKLFVELKKAGRAEVKLLDDTGRLLMHTMLQSSGSVDVHSLQAGSYIMQIRQNENVQNLPFILLK